MKHIRSYLSANKLESLFIAIVIVIMATANLWHVVYHYLQLPPGKVFVGITHHYEDYFYYLTQLTQGEQGNWLVKNSYTTEPIPATPLWMHNLLLGKIGGLFHLAPWVTYDLSVFIISICSLLVNYRVTRRLFPTNRLLRIGSFLIGTMTTVYYLVQKDAQGHLFINPYQYFYNYTEAFNRLGGVFHLILQSILSLLSVVTAANIISVVGRRHSPKEFFLPTISLSACLFLLMFINPIYVFVDVIALAILFLLYLPVSLSRQKLGRYLLVALLVGGPLLIPTIIINETFKLPFYEYFRQWESQSYATSWYIFLHSMGIIVLLYPFGIIPYLRKGGPLRIGGLIYAVIPIYIYFSQWPGVLHIPHFRLMQPPAYVFFGAIAVEGFQIIAFVLSRIMFKKAYTFIFLLTLTAYLAFQLPMLQVEIRTRTDNYALKSYVNYLDAPVYEALLYLKTQPRDKVALAINNIELLVPVVSGHQVYVAHRSLTYNYAPKIAESAKFFNGFMNPEESLQFLHANNIGYVLWEKKYDSGDRLKTIYPYLVTNYQNSGVIIFQVP